MASPCEVIIQTEDEKVALLLGQRIADEVWRIEDKYSRYNKSGMCYQINQGAGGAVPIDEETYLLLNFAQQCYELSDGLFDITSGLLRKVWDFSASSKPNSSSAKAFASSKASLPSNDEIFRIMQRVGWHKVFFDASQITLVKGMEIDFGGLGKEYAVDRAVIIAKKTTDLPVLVNLGGDLAVTKPRLHNEAWYVAVESPHASDKTENKDMIISLLTGALATSGDAKRFLMYKGKRYSHILNAKTGWPVENTPRSITVVAPQCIQAGILATMALLQGEQAEHFLQEQDIKFWARR